MAGSAIAATCASQGSSPVLAMTVASPAACSTPFNGAISAHGHAANEYLMAHPYPRGMVAFAGKSGGQGATP